MPLASAAELVRHCAYGSKNESACRPQEDEQLSHAISKAGKQGASAVLLRFVDDLDIVYEPSTRR